MNIVINQQLPMIPPDTTPLRHQGNFYHHVLSSLGYAIESPPVGDLLRRFHGLEGQWVVVSPIFWQATHNDAMIVDSGDGLLLSDEASRRWFAVFSDFIRFENLMTHYHDAHTWLLNIDGKPSVHAKPPYALHHHSLMPELNALDSTLFWQRLLTENQMFFSGHDLNKERVGEAPINGIWIWGSGQLRAPNNCPIYCDNPMLLQMASFLSTNVSVFDTATRVTKDALLLFDSLDSTHFAALKASVQKVSVHWYWNNSAYLSKPKRWYSRLLKRT